MSPYDPGDPNAPASPRQASPDIDIFVRMEQELQARIVEQTLAHRLATFNPLDPKLSAADFISYGLPPRPDNEDALRLWLELVQLSSTIEAATAKSFAFRNDIVISRLDTLSDDDPGAAAGGMAIPRNGRLGSSRNWSGAAILPRRGERFVQVLGSWTVPAVAAGEGAGPFVCSTWIGMDGLRRWMTSMPQMGTTQVSGDTGATLSNGSAVPNYFAWLQWWLLGRALQIPFVYQGVTIKPNTKIHCCVTRLPPDQPKAGNRNYVQFYIAVDGAGITAIVNSPPSNNPLNSDDDGHGVPARGASAEWILERPTALIKSPNRNVKKNQLYPLPAFDTIGSDDFAATLALSPDPGVIVTDPPPAFTPSVNFRTPHLIRMIEQRDNPSRIAVIATPISAKGGKVTVRHRP
jgi:Peptidase A4 family